VDGDPAGVDVLGADPEQVREQHAVGRRDAVLAEGRRRERESFRTGRRRLRTGWPARELVYGRPTVETPRPPTATANARQHGHLSQPCQGVSPGDGRVVPTKIDPLIIRRSRVRTPPALPFLTMRIGS
jgi:hypothetical protein